MFGADEYVLCTSVCGCWRVGGTSWIWPSCCCPSWASLWRRLRSMLPCPSTPPSFASWECWGLLEVWRSPPTLTQCETPTHSKLFQGAVLWRWCKTHIPGTPLFVIFCMADLSMVRAGCEPTRWHRDTQSADKLRRSEGREKHRVRKVSLGCEGAKTHCDSKWTKLQEAKERMGYSKEGWKRCKNKREINERDGIDEWLLTLK